MADAKQFTCACGWTVISPLGEDDALKHAQMHADEYHSDMSRERLRSSIKTVQIPQSRLM